MLGINIMLMFIFQKYAVRLFASLIFFFIFARKNL